MTNKLLTSDRAGVAPKVGQLTTAQLAVNTKDSRLYVYNGSEIIDIFGLVFDIPQTVLATRTFMIDGPGAVVKPATGNQPYYISFRTQANTEVGYIGKPQASSDNQDFHVGRPNGASVVMKDSGALQLQSQGDTWVEVNSENPNPNSGLNVWGQQVFDWPDWAGEHGGFRIIPAGAAGNRYIELAGDLESRNSGSPDWTESLRYFIEQSKWSVQACEFQAATYEATNPTPGSWAHSNRAALQLPDLNVVHAYNVWQVGTSGAKMQVLGAGGSESRLYPVGGNANYVGYTANRMRMYYAGTEDLQLDLRAASPNVNSKISMTEDAGSHGVTLLYEGAESGNTFQIITRENNVDHLAMLINRAANGEIWNYRKTVVRKAKDDFFTMYDSGSSANPVANYMTWNDSSGRRSFLGFPDDNSNGMRWLNERGTITIDKLRLGSAEGQSGDNDAAIRYDWGVDNFYRRYRGSANNMDWNTLYATGAYVSGGNSSVTNFPADPTAGQAYNYGLLLGFSSVGGDGSSGVKIQLYCADNNASPDTASRLPYFRSGWNNTFGSWRTLLTLKYADARYASISSDINLKEDVKEVTGALGYINQVGTYSYTKRNPEVTEMKAEEGGYTGDMEEFTYEVGFIAQEIEKIFPHLIKEDQWGFKTIDSRNNTLLAVAYKGIKELDAKNKELEMRIASIEAKLGLKWG